MNSPIVGACDPVCEDTRECFASVEFRGKRKCTILKDTYPRDGICQYCKPEATVTNGKSYPFNKNYYVMEEEEE